MRRGRGGGVNSKGVSLPLLFGPRKYGPPMGWGGAVFSENDFQPDPQAKRHQNGKTVKNGLV